MTVTPLKRLAELRVDRARLDPSAVLTLDLIESGTGAYLTDPWERPSVPPVAGVADVEPGDVLFGKLRPYLAKVIHVNRHAYASTELMCLRPKRGVEPRWFFYRMIAQPTVEWSAATSEGTKMPRTSWEKLGDFRVEVPSTATQRAIADYLDNETTRIDALIKKKHRLLTLLDEWEQAAMLSVLGDWRSVRTVSLRQLGTVVMTGPFGTQLSAAEYVEGGVPVVNPTHIRRGSIVSEDAVSVPPAVAHRLRRHRLATGDLVLGRKGDVGRAAIVTAEQQDWLCGSDSIAVRSVQDRLRPDLLVALLHLSLYRQQLEARSTGAMMANLNEATLLLLRVPELPVNVQDDVLREVSRVQSYWDGVHGRLTKQLDLLREHRQALITAAVTGDIKIPRAA